MNGPYAFSVFAKPSTGGMISSAPTVANALLKAREHARLLLGNDERRTHCEIEIYTQCVPCRGAGKIQHKNNRFKYRVCPDCKGEPDTYLHRESFARADASKCTDCEGTGETMNMAVCSCAAGVSA